MFIALVNIIIYCHSYNKTKKFYLLILNLGNYMTFKAENCTKMQG
jgi:hypothetical protein